MTRYEVHACACNSVAMCTAFCDVFLEYFHIIQHTTSITANPGLAL